MVSEIGKYFIRQVAQIVNGKTTITPYEALYKNMDNLASLLVDIERENNNKDLMAVGMSLFPLIDGVTFADYQGTYVYMIPKVGMGYSSNLNHRGATTLHNLEPKEYSLYISLD